MNEGFYSILKRLAVVNYDNGCKFTVRDRLDAISELLKNTDYVKVNTDGLFEMYTLNGIVPNNAVLLSTHVDCVKKITECYAEIQNGEYLRGTFDNLITNAVAVFLMTENRLTENTVIAFTGDEEINSRGAGDAVRFLNGKGVSFKTVVLDVTDMGWNQNACFTVENNFRFDGFGRQVVSACEQTGKNWSFVPSDPNRVPDYVPENRLINTEAECDESWEYDDLGVECFSFCIPTCGPMHSNGGVTLRKSSLAPYIDTLADILNVIK